MLDDLRNSAASSYEEGVPDEIPPEERPRRRASAQGSGTFLGMTAPQRFLLVLMLLILCCVLSSFALLLTGRVVLPFI